MLSYFSCRRSFLTLSILSLGFAAGCAGFEVGDGSLGSDRQPIVAGQIHFGHPSVGRLRASGGGSCSATLVGRRTVLTAAHCIREGRTHYFSVGGKWYSSTSATRHPQYQGSNLSFDIGVIVLSQAPTVKPSAIGLSVPVVGQKVTLVGYGVTGTNKGDSGTKRIATNVIGKVFPTRFAFYGSGNGVGNTCNGDSGGPAFSMIGGQEVVVGVTSSGTVPCGNDGFDTRVDTFSAWLIKTAKGDVATPSSGGVRQPGPSDSAKPTVRITSHTNGQTIQPGATVITALATDNDRVAEVHLVINGNLVGSLSAPPYKWDIRFIPGQKKIEVVAIDAAANIGKSVIDITVAGTLAGFGENCQSSMQCESRMCVRSTSLDRAYCTEVCSPNADTCPDGSRCVATQQQGFYLCALNNSPPAPGGGSVQGPAAQQPAQPDPLEVAEITLVDATDAAQPRGGCSVGSRGGARDGAALGLVLLGLLALVARRRRSRR